MLFLITSTLIFCLLVFLILFCIIEKREIVERTTVVEPRIIRETRVVREVVRERPVPRRDPLAQSFTVNETGAFLTSFDVYFAAKDETAKIGPNIVRDPTDKSILDTKKTNDTPNANKPGTAMFLTIF